MNIKLRMIIFIEKKYMIYIDLLFIGKHILEKENIKREKNTDKSILKL